MPRVTEYPLRVRSTDVDSQGIVNNARYFEFFEQARLAHLREIDVWGRPRANSDGSRGFTIAETTCRFRKPLVGRDEVVVQAWTEEIRNRSFIFGYRVVMASDGTVAAEGSSAQVWLDAENRPTPLPDDIRRSLEQSMA
jgi:acyl-CoA thioester hydrolase